MSASLVGSEMCIRDSSMHSGVLQHWVGSVLWCFLYDGELQGFIVHKVECCLLYTSDAADDM
eukprot:1423805-Alexandrium_andersonii.AAC.1